MRTFWCVERVIFISILSSNEVELQLLVLVPTSHLQEKKKMEKFLSQVSLDGWRPRTWTHINVKNTESQVLRWKTV